MRIFKPTPRIKIITENNIIKFSTKKRLITDHISVPGLSGQAITIGTFNTNGLLKKITQGNDKTKDFVKKQYVTFFANTEKQAEQILNLITEAHKSKKSYTIHLKTPTHKFEITEY